MSKEISIEELSLIISEDIGIKKKLSESIVRAAILEIRYKNVVRGYKSTFTKRSKGHQLKVPVLKGQSLDNLFHNLAPRTNLDRESTRHAVQAFKKAILSAAMKNNEVEVEYLGTFKRRERNGMISGVTFYPDQPGKLIIE